MFDVRFFVDLETSQIIREIKAKEMKYDLLKSVSPYSHAPILYHSCTTKKILVQCVSMLIHRYLYIFGYVSVCIKQRLPPEKPHDLTPLTDPNFVSQALEMLKTEESMVPSQASSSTEDKPKRWRNMLGAHLDLASIPVPY
jgi:hypothetical protein